MNGVVFGLDPTVISDGREWHLLIQPGLSIQNDVEVWDLGHTLTESVGTFSGIEERTLRHPRDGWYPVLAGDDTGSIRLVGSITVNTVATLFTEGLYAVVYLEDLPPYNSLSFALPTGATISPATSSYNRYRFDASLAGVTLDVDYTLGRCAAHNGLSAITLVGPVTNSYVTYRTDIPIGSTGDAWYVDHRFIGWTNSNVQLTLVTIDGLEYATALGLDTLSILSTTSGDSTPRQYLFAADFNIEVGDVRLEVEGFEGYHTSTLGRNFACIPCEGTLLTINVTLGASGTSLTWYGGYLVETVDPENRFYIGTPAYQSYLCSTPYATVPLEMSLSTNEPFRAIFNEGWTVQAPYWVRAVLFGSVGGVTVPYVGPILATLDAGSPVAVLAKASRAPGEYWFECNPSVLATMTLQAGSVLGTVTLLPSDNYSPATYSLWLDVRSEQDGKTHRMSPRLFSGEGLYTSASVDPATIHIIGGSFAGTMATTSLATIDTEVVVLGGTYAYTELTIGGDLYVSPRVPLPHFGDLLTPYRLPDA